MTDKQMTRTYLGVVPEGVKEELSRSWSDEKAKTYGAAKIHGITLKIGESFNKAVAFTLGPGAYHMCSAMMAVPDISDKERLRVGVVSLIRRMVDEEQMSQCIPMLASNICDWDSAYAKGVGANSVLKEAIVSACFDNNIILTGGETANLGEQVRKTGMGLMFTIFSRYYGFFHYDNATRDHFRYVIDAQLQETFRHLADKEGFKITYGRGVPLLVLNKKFTLIMTADGTGSKSMVCEQVRKREDISDTLAMCGDDAPREGAFPIAASIGVHAENTHGRSQIIESMKTAGRRFQIPILGSTFDISSAIHTYTMNGVVLSNVQDASYATGKGITENLPLVLLFEEQRSNGITLQRRVLEETFGPEWYSIKVQSAFKQLNGALGKKYPNLIQSDSERTLGELVAKPSTPYFRVDSMMPRGLLEKVGLRINVSSGGLIGKSRRLLEPFNLGADFTDVFDAPELILLLQMASRLRTSKGIIPDKVAYYTWGCGNGAVVGTTEPESTVEYYRSKGISARVGGLIRREPRIMIVSKALDSKGEDKPHILTHEYTESPLG